MDAFGRRSGWGRTGLRYGYHRLGSRLGRIVGQTQIGLVIDAGCLAFAADQPMGRAGLQPADRRAVGGLAGRLRIATGLRGRVLICSSL